MSHPSTEVWLLSCLYLSTCKSWLSYVCCSN
jgi:hypothetical protein